MFGVDWRGSMNRFSKFSNVPKVQNFAPVDIIEIDVSHERSVITSKFS